MVSIRLKREGSKDRPFYRLVVADSRSRRDGRFIESVGTYNPMDKAVENYEINLERIDAWVSKGARPSDTVASIVRKVRKKAAATADA